MIISNHHILYDGWSNGIILKEFFNAYNTLHRNEEPLRPAKTQFKEFIKWSQTTNPEKQETFWQNYLKDQGNQLELPVKEKKRSTTGTAAVALIFPTEMQEQLATFIKQIRLTPATLLYTAWGLLVQKYCDTDDVIIGTTVSGRNAKLKGIEDVVGLFINTIPLRIKREPHQKINRLLTTVNETLQAREEYESTPLLKIRAYREIGSTPQQENRQALFDTVMVIENYPLETLTQEKNTHLSPRSYKAFERTHYDLTVRVTIAPDGAPEMDFIYRQDAFSRQTIVGMANHYETIVKSILKNPGEEVSRLQIIPEKEKKQHLESNETKAPYPETRTLHGLFEEQVQRTPGSIALQGPGGAPITYREMDNKTTHWARHMRNKGIKPGKIVAIMLDRSPEMVQAIMAVLKNNTAYLPILPEYPSNRITYMLNDSNAALLLTTRELIAKKKLPVETDILLIDEIDEPANKKEAKTGTTGTTEDATQPAYIIYTSGSTGKPKGVMVAHQAAVNVLHAMQTLYPLTGNDAYLLKTSYVFDVSVTELFGWYQAGGRLVILEKEQEKDLAGIVAAVKKWTVTHINFVPSMFNVFVDTLTPQNIAELSTLKYIFLAGEALLPELVEKFQRLNRQIQLENIYGPTEATVYASRYPLAQWKSPGIIPIGKPLQNMRLYILDKHRSVQPTGVPGQLCIAGTGLALGYLNNPQMTADKFIPFTEEEKNVYLTGDLARRLPGGNIQYLGRLDNQVKVRGFRIELGEIENLLLKHPQVKETSVVLHTRQTGENTICAYVAMKETTGTPGTEEPGHQPEMAHQLSEYLSLTLPNYMIP
ncbi:MAG: amino acid adenylation domain-containing protein, partial [bacterium]|nr:amino acid adenylation domain-containing protein [bacterium]